MHHFKAETRKIKNQLINLFLERFKIYFLKEHYVNFFIKIIYFKSLFKYKVSVTTVPLPNMHVLYYIYIFKIDYSQLWACLICAFLLKKQWRRLSNKTLLKLKRRRYLPHHWSYKIWRVPLGIGKPLIKWRVIWNYF